MNDKYSKYCPYCSSRKSESCRGCEPMNFKFDPDSMETEPKIYRAGTALLNHTEERHET